MIRRVAIALGSNLGDRRAAIVFAAEQLAPFVANLQLSDLIETEPDGEGCRISRVI
jgi:7,8-dihydro-6-hydroxymethylpterin-pyrophosphokinase